MTILRKFSRVNVPLLILFLLISFLTTNPSIARADKIDLEIRSVDVKAAQVEGSRGPALAVLSDGRLLLGEAILVTLYFSSPKDYCER